MPTVTNIVKGSAVITSGQGTTPIISLGEEVSDSRSIVMHTFSHSGGAFRDRRDYFSFTLSASGGATAGTFDQISLQRRESSYAADSYIEWTVIEFDTDVSVQSGNEPMGASLVTDIPITTLTDPDAAMVVVDLRCLAANDSIFSSRVHSTAIEFPNNSTMRHCPQR